MSEFSRSAIATDLLKVVCAFISRPESHPFREPVDWESLGLTDYPQIVKKPMDLGTIKTKLESGNYSTPEEVANDIRLVWSNCMIYNQDGSDFYHLADKFSRKFEDTYSQLRKTAASEDPDRVPNVDDRIKMSYDLFRIDNTEMGKVLSTIELMCPEALNKRGLDDEIMVNIDRLSSNCFHEISKYLSTCVDSKGKKRKNSSSGGAMTGGSGSAVGNPKKK